MSYDSYSHLMHFVFMRIAGHVILWWFALIFMVAIASIRGKDF